MSTPNPKLETELSRNYRIAKAAMFDARIEDGNVVIPLGNGGKKIFNPHKNSGEAFTLQVQFNLQVSVTDTYAVALTECNQHFTEDARKAPYEAARRAVCRAVLYLAEKRELEKNLSGGAT